MNRVTSRNPSDVLRSPSITAILIGILSVSVAGTAAANEESVFQTNQGIIKLEAGEPRAALKHFRTALRADRDDEDARYYLAHTFILVGAHKNALTILGEKELEYWDADYLRGISYFHLDEADKAETYFERSATDNKNPRSRFYLGLIAYQAGNSDVAARHLTAAKGLEDDLAAYRELYLGLLATSSGDDERGQAYFESVRKEFPESPAAELAGEMLGVKPKRKQERDNFIWMTRIMEQYDTNPGLVQSDESLARIYHPNLTDATGSLRTAAYTGIRWRFGKAKGFGGSMGASVYGSFHHFNHDAMPFNVLQPAAGLDLGYRGGKWSLTVPLNFSLTYLGTSVDHYSTRLGTGLGFGYAINKRWSARTGLFLDLQSYGTGNPRNGVGFALPLEGIFKFKGGRAIAGYTFNRYGASEVQSPWSFTGHRLHLGALYRPVKKLTLFATSSVYVRGYDDPVNNQDRNDTELGFESGLRYAATDIFDLGLGYDGTFQSSIPEFSYNRHILTLSFGLTF